MTDYLHGSGSLVSKSVRTFLCAVMGAFSATVDTESFDTSFAIFLYGKRKMEQQCCEKGNKLLFQSVRCPQIMVWGDIESFRCREEAKKIALESPSDSLMQAWIGRLVSTIGGGVIKRGTSIFVDHSFGNSCHTFPHLLYFFNNFIHHQKLCLITKISPEFFILLNLILHS